MPELLWPVAEPCSGNLAGIRGGPILSMDDFGRADNIG